MFKAADRFKEDPNLYDICYLEARKSIDWRNLGKVPIDPDICKHSHDGGPFILQHINSSATKAFVEIVRKIKDSWRRILD